MTDQKKKPQSPTTAPQSPPAPSVAWVEQEAALRKALTLLPATRADRLVQMARRKFLSELTWEICVADLPETVRQEIGGDPDGIIVGRIVQGRDGTRRLVIG